MSESGGEQLEGLLLRVERLREEQRGIGEDIKDVMAEAKSQGHDMLAFREMLRLRKMDADKRRDFQNALEVYSTQLGLL
jgi:uncharacterized protein (UPF0335 family)